MGSTLSPHAHETPGPHEEELIQAIVDATIAGQQKSHKPGSLARRDVHSKSHGTLRAEFRVLAEIPATYKIGLFAEPASYSALVRLSNGALGMAPDILPNIRGLAIKLLGVPGQKLLPGEESSSEHDFLMANDRTFFVDRIEYMVMLARKQMGKIAQQHPVIFLNMLEAMFKLVKNPLQTSYFSQVPYLFGEQAAKYALIPQQNASFFSLPNLFDRDYLRHGTETLLHKGPVKMTFCVQLKQAGEPIEDSSQLWRGKLVPVAELTFPATNDSVLESDGEALSFNPWRVLKEHRPLGWPGRTRRAVYVADFQWRRKANTR